MAFYAASANEEQIVIGEIFPLPIRARGVALSTASNWLWNTVRTPFSPSMSCYFADSS